ncbi:MAG: DUF6273 domain-containing protein [Oscillospiraceae bacterium]|nr:DUF6273 domain-containing protein [Oscillospiraceae bacterium]
MVKRMIRFPLKMKNGAEVRSIEELRANADVESVMQYYFSGQLSRWCRAFNINELPEKITENNEMFVNRILETIGIELPAEDIHNYVNNNFGNSAEVKEVPDTDEEKITDDKEVKNRLKNIMNGEINLDNYMIEVTPIEDESGTIKKYRVCITNEQTEQYSRFVIPYELDNDYTRELFEKDLYKKIKYAVENAEKSVEFFNKQTGSYESLNVGDTFDFGNYNGKPIKWKILRKNNDSIYVISTEKLCRTQFHNNRNGSNNWTNSDIRRWLNGEFYSNAFTENEKDKIGTVESDKVTLLSKEEAESLMTEQERAIGSDWWLRSAHPSASVFAWYVRDDGMLRGNYVYYEVGVRPALILKF